jgi:hypothetical protein
MYRYLVSFTSAVEHNIRVSSQKVGATLPQRGPIGAVARLGRREACPYPKMLRRYTLETGANAKSVNHKVLVR